MAIFNKYSLYSNAESDGFYRDYYKPLEISYDDSDMFIVVTEDFHHKPGNLANMLYGSPRFSWVFSYFNRNIISDIIFDLEAGSVLRVPTKERLLSYF